MITQEIETTQQETNLSILKPFDIAKAELIKMSEDYKNLVVTEETFEEAKKVRSTIREKRYLIQNIVDENKKILNKIKSNEELKGEVLINIIKPTEDRIDAGIKAIEGRKAEEKTKKDREAKEKLENRIKTLFGLGVTFNGLFYLIGTVSTTQDIVKDLKDSDFDTLLENVKQESNKLALQKAEEDKLKKEEEERLKRIAQEQLLKAEQDRIAQENEAKSQALKAESDRLEKEKADFRKKVLEARQNILISAGMHLTTRSTLKYEDIEISFHDLEAKSEEQFQSYSKEAKIRIDSISETMRIESDCKKKESEDAKIKADQAEKERQDALLPDKEKLLKFAESLSSIEFPKDLKSGEALKIITEAGGLLTKIQDYITKKTNEL